MSTRDMSQHKEAYYSEASAHVASMNASLLQLEKTPTEVECFQELLREAHTLKGMSAVMSYSQTAALCHLIEDTILAVKESRIPLSDSTDALFESFDLLTSTLRAILNDEPEPEGDAVAERLRDLLACPGKAGEAPPRQRQGTHVVEPLRTVAVSVEKLDTLLNLTEELLVGRMRLGRIMEKVRHSELSAAVESVGRLIGDLQYNVMQARMVPVGFVFERFPRMVRDLARSQGKDVNLVLEGGDLELDRAIIDEIGECLVHLLRNAVDHGIEAAADRPKTKPPQSTIRLVAARSKQAAVITVEDDGAGLDLEAITRAAVQRGVLGASATHDQIIQSIFQGVSTTSGVTAVSGRGMGLNIVKRRAESIGGTISVDSAVGRGTKFTIAIPLSMAVIKTLFVGVGGRTYAIPVANIERLVNVDANDVKKALGQEAIVLEKKEIPVRRLDGLFSCPSSRTSRQALVIVQKGRARVGLAVDSLMSTEEIVIKPLSGALRYNRFFAGSALVGSGEVVMVLEVGHLMDAPGRAVSFENTFEGMGNSRAIGEPHDG